MQYETQFAVVVWEVRETHATAWARGTATAIEFRHSAGIYGWLRSAVGQAHVYSWPRELIHSGPLRHILLYGNRTRTDVDGFISGEVGHIHEGSPELRGISQTRPRPSNTAGYVLRVVYPCAPVLALGHERAVCPGRGVLLYQQVQGTHPLVFICFRQSQTHSFPCSQQNPDHPCVPALCPCDSPPPYLITPAVTTHPHMWPCSHMTQI